MPLYDLLINDPLMDKNLLFLSSDNWECYSYAHSFVFGLGSVIQKLHFILD